MSRTTKSVTLDDDVIKKIEIRGKREGRNFTNMVEHILKQEFAVKRAPTGKAEKWI